MWFCIRYVLLLYLSCIYLSDNYGAQDLCCITDSNQVTYTKLLACIYVQYCFWVVATVSVFCSFSFNILYLIFLYIIFIMQVKVADLDDASSTVDMYY